MTVSIDFNKPLRLPGQGRGTQARYIQITQSDSSTGEVWTVPDLPIMCSLLSYKTAFTNAGATPLVLRPTLGSATPFTFGDEDGTGIARLRRQTAAVYSASQVPLLLPAGSLYGTSGLSRAVAANESLVTQMIVALSPELVTNRAAETFGDWQIGNPSSYITQVGATFNPADAATATDWVPVSGGQQVELWIDFDDDGAGTDVSDLRITWEFRRSSTTQGAPVLYEDVASAAAAAGIYTLPSLVYEIQDQLGALTLPGDYPFTRHYVLPVRNWSGEIRALIRNAGATADRTDATPYMIVRGG